MYLIIYCNIVNFMYFIYGKTHSISLIQSAFKRRNVQECIVVVQSASGRVYRRISDSQGHENR